MADFFLAPSLVTLRDEINKMWPKRDRGSDGWIGDSSHAARVSDHNPCWDCAPPLRGVVRAIDVDHDGISENVVLAAMIGDPRAWYVIHNRTIWSVTYGWRPHAYTGSNPHTGHIHVSILHTVPAALGTGTWFGRQTRTTLPAVDLSNMVRVFTSGEGGPLPGVRRIQRALNEKIHSGLRVDGLPGPKTRKEYGLWQRTLGYSGTDANGVPGLVSLTRLGRPTFRYTGFRVVP